MARFVAQSSSGASAGHPLTEPVFAALRQIIDPCSAASVSPMNLVEMGLIDRVEFSNADSRVDVFLRLTSPQCLMVAYMTKAAKELIGALDGVTTVEVHADHGLDWDPSLIAPAAQQRRQLLLEVRSNGLSGCGSQSVGSGADRAEQPVAV